MFDLGWVEILLIGGTALIVVGPKDLPVMFKKVGMFVGKARKMAREFQATMESAADESGLKETSNILNTIHSVGSPKKLGNSVLRETLKSDNNANLTPEDKSSIKKPPKTENWDDARAKDSKEKP